MAGQGRHDPVSGLPVRVLDFLKALDTIVDAAIAERVDLVLFAGDAYKDRTPAPTFQREWGRRIMRLSQAGIPTFLLVGNHDVSPASGRANALQEFDTLQVPKVIVASEPALYTPNELWGLQMQIIALPYRPRSNIMASLLLSGTDPKDVFDQQANRLSEVVIKLLEQTDPTLPVILTAHGSVQGAKVGAERNLMLGGDLELQGSMVRDLRLDYVALGHIHKWQNLGEGEAHTIIYPGSIEKVDWGEAADRKRYVIAEIEKGRPTRVLWQKLQGRPFYDKELKITSPENILEQAKEALPTQEQMANSMVRLTLTLPRAWDNLLDEAALREYCNGALEFHFVRKLEMEARFRFPNDQSLSSLTPQELLGKYWGTTKINSKIMDDDEIRELQKLANEIIQEEP